MAQLALGSTHWPLPEAGGPTESSPTASYAVGYVLRRSAALVALASLAASLCFQVSSWLLKAEN